MIEIEGPATEGEFEAANSQLSKGLKTCRSVVDNYRALLSQEQNPDGNGEEGEEDAAPEAPDAA